MNFASTNDLPMRRILVTSALPYANGPIHLGHLLEHIQTDIWVRFQRLSGNQCIYVCADDTHGTGITLWAQREGVSEEELIERVRVEHVADFERFHISHDNYYSTHSQENQHYVNLIYNALRDQGFIYSEEIEQLFDPVKEMFLADRFVRGTCPRCGAENQPGDNCDVCGATYDARDLIDPVSELSNAKPELKRSTHYFVDLPKFADFLGDYIVNGSQQPEVANKLREWVAGDLRGWDISRDPPYFGFPIPDAPGKFFYVWMDAPIGYMASFQHWCDQNDESFEDFWNADSGCELHHFIGKDVINFHCLFWPAVLSASGFRTPTKAHVHGFVTVDGQKMSKSRGTFIQASTYLDHLDPDYLRYYFASRLSSNLSDLDISFDDFVARVNSDLVGKLVNIASRSAGFIAKNFNDTLADKLSEPELWETFVTERDQLAEWYEKGDTNRVVRRVMELADLCNQYLAKQEPWNLIKDPDRLHTAQEVCTMGINLFRVLTGYLKPIVPGLTARSEAYLNAGEITWENLSQPLLGKRVGKFERLLNRVESQSISAMIEAGVETTPLTNGDTNVTADEPPVADQINIDEFLKVDLRIARVKQAEYVDGADKLLRLQLDVGNEERTVFAGVRSAYDPAQLVDKRVVVVANLAPRKMKFGVSEGMVLAAGPGGSDIFLISPDEGAAPGMRVT